MKFLFGCLFLLFLTGLYNNLHAQATGTAIQGKILTENRSPAALSTVILLKYKDSSIVSSAITDKNGQFQFFGVLPDSYLLLVSAVGYNKSYTGPYTVIPGRNFKIPDIILSASTRLLKEVSVVGSRPEIEASPGKITLNIQNSLTDAGASAYDILRQSPGVRVDNNNSITIIGRQNALITIDGKQTNLAGEDLIDVLRGIQSNMIDRIELITGGSAKYDASGGGVINIILKKGQNTGANGTFTAVAGYGKYYKGSTGIVFNDRTDKFNIFGNYNYADNKTFHDFTSDRSINFENVLSQYNVDYNGIQKNQTNTFSLGTDYFISPGQTIGFLVNGSITDDNFVKNNNLNIYNQAVFDSLITANANLNRHISRVNYNLNYSGKLDKTGKTLTADVNYTTYSRSSAEYITNDFFDASGIAYRPTDSLQNLSPSKIHIWLSRVDFTDPLSKTSKLEAGVKNSNVVSNNDLIFGPKINGVYESDPMFSNDFKYTENVNAGYVNYENKLDKFSIAAALRAEQTIAKGNSITLNKVVNSNYIDLFPNVLLSYKHDDKNDFSLNYSRGITRPNYELLNPFLRYVDLYDFDSGNPNLKPEYSTTVQLSYNYNKTFVVTLYSLIVSDVYDFNVYEQNDTSKVNLTTQKNFGTEYNYGLRLFAPVVFTSWWNADFNFDASYQRYVAYPVNGNLNKGTQDIIFSTTQYFKISNTITASFTDHYESPTFYGVDYFKANYYMDAGIGKQLFNNRGSLKLSALDIFNTKRDRKNTNYENLDMTTVVKRESQVVRLTFTYRFGKTSLKNSTHHTGNEDEQKRTNITN